MKNIVLQKNKKVSEQQFWTSYLRLLNAMNSEERQLADKDIKIASFVLSLDLNKSYFNKASSKIISNSLKNCSYSEINRVKERLLRYKLLEELDNPDDARSKIYRFIPLFFTIKKLSKENKKISFTFEYNMNYETKRTLPKSS